MSLTEKESHHGDRSVIRVFVSSTWFDLQEERRAVEAALNRLGETQFLGMEYFGSHEETPREVSMAKLEECQLYLGIIGGRFGSGITAEEYRRAHELGIPRLMYRMESPAWIESEPDQQARHQQFLTEIGTTFSWFPTPDRLATNVATDLHSWLVENIYKPRMREAGFAADLADAYISPEPVYERLDLARFTGRDWLKKEVDDFLASYDRGYFILEADAGLGKTAFLAHLVKERRWIHHFVELARGQDGVRHGLRSLASQIVFRWKPEMAGSPSDVSRPDFLERLLFAAAASRDRTLPGEKIVLVVDALDESAANPDQNVMGLPRVLPQGVYLVVSHRPVQVALEIEAARWPPVRLESADLSNLNDVRQFLQVVANGERVASLLTESNVTPEDFVSALVERSHGVWIYLHYILEELERGERRPLDLEALPRGLWAYYAKYWQSRRADPTWTAQELPLLAALAAAQEDVSASLLCAFAGIPETPQVNRLMEEWRPFLAGSTAEGERRYRCYHASFREFLEGRADWSRLTEAEHVLADELASATSATHSRIADRALALWGGLDTGLEGLQDPTRRDLDGGYALRHLVAHVQSADRLRDLSRLLRATRTRGKEKENVWYAVHEKTRDLDGYLSDVSRVWAAATAASEAAISRNEPAATVTLEARCALLFSSVRELAELVRPRLLAALLEEGVWEPKHALRYASEIGDTGRRLLAMARLVPLLPKALRERAFDRAASAARWSDALALAELPSDLPRDLLEAILRQVLTRTWRKAEALTALVSKLPADLIAEVLSFLRTADPKDDWSELLLALIPLVSSEERENLLARAKEAANWPYSQVRTLSFRLKLAPFVSSDERAQITREALQYARSNEARSQRTLLLARVLPCLRDSELENVAREALETTAASSSYGLKETLAELIPHLPPKLHRIAEKQFLSKSWQWDDHFCFFLPHWAGQPRRIENALSRVEKLWNHKDKALAALVSALPDQLVDRALAAALAEHSSPYALDALAPRLTAAQLERAVSSLLATGVSAEIYPKRERWQDTIKLQSASPGTGGDVRRAGIEVPGRQTIKEMVEHLLLLAAAMQPADREPTISKALQLLSGIRRDSRVKIELLFAIAVLSDNDGRDNVVAQRAGFMIRAGVFKQWIDEVPRDLLIALAPHLSERRLRDALAWGSAMKRDTDISPILRAVIPRLPEAAAAEVLLLDDSGWYVFAPADAETKKGPSSPLFGLIVRLWELLPERIRSRWNRQKMVLDVTSFFPKRMRIRTLVGIVQAHNGWLLREAVDLVGRLPLPEQVTVLVDLLPFLRPDNFGHPAARALIAALSIKEPAARADALEAFSSHVHPFFQDSLRRLSSVTRSGKVLNNSMDVEEALEVLAQTASADALMRFLEPLSDEQRQPLLARAKENVERIGIAAVRSWALLQLVPYLPELEGEQIIRESVNHYPFSTAASHLIERWGHRQSPFREPIARAVLDQPFSTYPEGGDLSKVLVALAAHLPDSVLAEALDKAWTIDQRYDVLEALAARFVSLPAGELHSHWRTALLELSGKNGAVFDLRALLPIIDRLGDQYEI